jgi:hypothetical protein
MSYRRRSLVLALVAAIVLAAIYTAGRLIYASHGSPDLQWRERAQRELVLAERTYADWALLQRSFGAASQNSKDISFEEVLRHTPKDALVDMMTKAEELRAQFFNLWSVTRHCAFSDIPCDDLVARAREVLDRYRHYIGMTERLSPEQRMRAGLEEDVDLLASEYWYPALVMMQEIVSFHQFIGISGDYECRNIAPARRAELRRLMTQWVKDNEKRVVFDAAQQRFVQAGSHDSFDLPVPLDILAPQRN